MAERLSEIQEQGAGRRLPEWLRFPAARNESVTRLRAELRQSQLHTVCESARCPNIHECYHRGTATFLILGEVCTRGCGFCSVPKGSPEKREFSPHLTLARAQRSARASDIAIMGQTVQKMTLGEIGRLQVARIHLIRSDLQPSGAVYTELARAELREDRRD